MLVTIEQERILRIYRLKQAVKSLLGRLENCVDKELQKLIMEVKGILEEEP